ncbi:hypothetical protein HDU82_008520, partial [Entophlyctis luteolus]
HTQCHCLPTPPHADEILSELDTILATLESPQASPTRTPTHTHTLTPTPTPTSAMPYVRPPRSASPVPVPTRMFHLPQQQQQQLQQQQHPQHHQQHPLHQHQPPPVARSTSLHRIPPNKQVKHSKSSPTIVGHPALQIQHQPSEPMPANAADAIARLTPLITAAIGPQLLPSSRSPSPSPGASPRIPERKASKRLAAHDLTPLPQSPYSSSSLSRAPASAGTPTVVAIAAAAPASAFSASADSPITPTSLASAATPTPEKSTPRNSDAHVSLASSASGSRSSFRSSVNRTMLSPAAERAKARAGAVDGGVGPAIPGESAAVAQERQAIYDQLVQNGVIKI